MPAPYSHIPDELKRQAVQQSGEPRAGNRAGGGTSPPRPSGQNKSARAAADAAAQGHPQRRLLFKKRRAGVVLTREEVKAIKTGRKKLRKEMRAKGLRKKSDFELTASSLGLYFDKHRLPFLLWLGRHWLGSLLAALAALIAVLFLFSMVTRMRGFFTINLSQDMFRQGFTLSDKREFTNPTTQLFAVPAEDVPCISINQIPKDVDEIDGEHNDVYFAYTYYIRNDGDQRADFKWNVDLTVETQDVSQAVWLMLFEDGEMTIYAKPDRQTGQPEALPPVGDNSRGYRVLPIREVYPNSSQFQLIRNAGGLNYYRVIPENFEGEARVASGERLNVQPGEIHKYTVVMWLEGDDPDATDDLIGGHMGVEMDFRMSGEAEDNSDNSLRARWKKFWNRIWEDLDFWQG